MSVPHAPSARSLYPSFLSVHESLFIQFKCGCSGLYDAFRWNVVISAILTDTILRQNLLKSFLLNLLSLLSVYVFNFLLLPLVRHKQNWLYQNVGWFYQALWLFPIISVSLYLNNIWCSAIARRTYLLRYGPRASALAYQSSTDYMGMLNALATSAYRFLMIFSCLLFPFVLGYVPYVGPVMSFLFLCWVDAFYCFEFVWIARGMSLARRIRHIEERWAYYLAFGLPVTILCSYGPGLANAATFALLFPVYIILAMHARPLPIDPYSPASHKGEDDSQTTKHPSPFVPIRLPIFMFIVTLNDTIVKLISIKGSATYRQSTSREESHRARSRLTHMMKEQPLSDETESAEEGTQTGFVAASGPVGNKAASRVAHGLSQGQKKATKGRIVIGRKKVD
ncbi:hypothetical protein AMATHDRAFT_140128 [Amanita thiersii Skay4041]|uniref:Uncharacterized protein n=1 Tax=Amanita thiersii Skay4041 TaxID=703135 RepID=A0A2A9NXE9_9AGAR|nr:hypothetical protein AMATHDRAFT_140128 [Amanita thiersii Skay4041]